MADCQTYMTQKQVAEMLGLSTATLESWRIRGKGPRYLKLGRCVRYLVADLEAWIERRVSTSVAA
jgi:excisionase family DNA binding protein